MTSTRDGTALTADESAFRECMSIMSLLRSMTAKLLLRMGILRLSDKCRMHPDKSGAECRMSSRRLILRMAFFILNSTLSILHSTFAQDPHFSQWSNAPLLMTPALTGVFDG